MKWVCARQQQNMRHSSRLLVFRMIRETDYSVQVMFVRAYRVNLNINMKSNLLIERS